MLARQKARVALLPLVEAFEARKRAAGAIDYADQVAYAARIAVASAEVGRRERTRWQVVLLDEYQDTSVGQLRMLEALFGGDTGHPVLAVGDPRQSIYGWRGASAGTIERFARTFPGLPGRSAERLTLATSWRNDGPCSRSPTPSPAMLPPPGPAAARPHRRPHRRCRLGERRAVRDGGRGDGRARRPAGRLLARRGPAGRGEPGSDRPWRCWCGRASSCPGSRRPCASAACRSRWSGSGGLLEVPEVSDVVATLTVLVDPTAGDALGRLLTGARWRIGPRDLAALEARARALVRARRPVPDDAAGGRDAGGPTAPQERGSIIEALDDLGSPEAYSAEAHRRFRRLAGELSRLRTRLGEALPDLVDEVARTLGLETELASAPEASPAGARAHLDALHGVAAEFTELAELPSLPAFLGYLRDADERERGLEPGEVAVNPEAVQLLTGHSAKGLEWDVVAVPGMTGDQFPAKSDTSDSWIKDPGALPADLRLTDREELPRLRLPVPGSGDQAVVKQALEDYVQEWKDFGRGRGDPAGLRRRHPRPAPAALLGQLVARRQDRLRAVVPADDGPRRLRRRRRPGRALGGRPRRRRDEPRARGVADRRLARRPALRPAAPGPGRGPRNSSTPRRPTRSTGTRALGGGDPVVDQWIRDADLLLRERARHAAPTVDVPLPSHLSVSALVTLRRDPAELARRLRRPMPAAPAPQARRGTAFHAWLEERFGAARLRGPRRTARVGRRVRRSRRRARRTAGGLPRQRVGRPPAGRGGGAVRDAARAADPARPDRRRLRRRRRRLRGHRLEDRAAAVRRPNWPPPACSWPPTGWAGRGSPACRSSGSAPASTTSRRGSPFARSTCSTRPGCSPSSPGRHERAQDEGEDSALKSTASVRTVPRRPARCLLVAPVQVRVRDDRCRWRCSPLGQVLGGVRVARPASRRTRGPARRAASTGCTRRSARRRRPAARRRRSARTDSSVGVLEGVAVALLDQRLGVVAARARARSASPSLSRCRSRVVVLHPHHRDLLPARLVDEAGDVGDDGVALLCARRRRRSGRR